MNIFSGRLSHDGLPDMLLGEMPSSDPYALTPENANLKHLFTASGVPFAEDLIKK